MPERDSSPLSYQTTMPEYPDVSYEAYQDAYGYSGSSRFSTSIGTWWDGAPSYENWRVNKLDEYNARMSAYNTWLSTGAGQRASALSGDYNPSYFGIGNPSASPLDYQQAPESSGFSEMAQGISGLFNLVSAIQGLKMTGAKIAGQEAQNNLLRIEAKYRDQILKNRGLGLGFQADWRRMQNENELASRYPELVEMADQNAFSLGYGSSSYDLTGTKNSFGYQRSYEDIEKLRLAQKLLSAQAGVANWTAKEKKFYVENMQSIERDILSGKLTLLGETTGFVKSRKEYQDKVNAWYETFAKLRQTAEAMGIKQGVVNYMRGMIGFFNDVTPDFGDLTGILGAVL